MAVLRFFLYLLLFLFLLLAILWGGLQTSLGRIWITHYLEYTLSSAEKTVTLTPIEGTLPSDITLRQATWRDKQGAILLDIRNAHLHWSPSALLRGTIEIQQLTALKITYAPPASPPPSKKPPSFDSLLLLLKLPKLQIHTLSLQQLLINTRQQHFAYKASGGRTVYKDAVTTSLTIEDLANPASRATAKVSFTPSNANLSIESHIHEPAGGGIATLLKLPADNDLDFTFSGTAPLSNWQGNFALTLASKPVLTGTLHTSPQQDGLHCYLDTSVTLPAIPHDPARGKTHLILSPKDGILIPVFSLTNSQHHVTFSGSLRGNIMEGNLGSTLALPASLSTRLGTQASISLHIKKNTSSLALTQLHATLKEGIITGNATLQLNNKTIQSTLIYTGSTAKDNTITAQLSGGFDTVLTALITGKNIPGFPAFTAKLDAQQLLHSPNGNIHITTHSGKQEYRLDSAFISTPELLAFSSLIFSTANTKLAGNIRFIKATKLLAGTLEGTIPDIAVFTPLTRQEMHGSAHINATLTPSGSMQNAALHIKTADIRTGSPTPLTIRNADITLKLADIFKTKTGEMTAHLEAVTRNNLQLTTLSLTAKGTPRKLDFSTTTNGQLYAPFTVVSNGSLRIEGDEKTLQIQAFSGRYNNRSFTLSKAASFSTSPRGTTINDTTLAYARGTLQLQGTYDTANSDIALQIDNVPLNALPFASARYISGKAQGKLRITGNPAIPKTTLSLTITNLLYQNTAQGAAIPALSFLNDAALEKGQLTLHTALKAATVKGAESRLTMAADFSLLPFRFSLPRNKPLRGNVTMALDAGMLTTVFLLDNQKLAGMIQTELALGGTLDKPELTGTATMKNGLYEHTTNGIFLHNINATITAVSTHNIMLSATASDSGKGHINAKGTMDLNGPNAGLLVDFSLNKLYLIERDNLDIRATGNGKISGALRSPLLSGALLIDKANIQIPDRIAPAITKLNVTEINIPADRKPKRASQPTDIKSDSPLRLNLALDLPNRIFLRGRGVDTELSGKLTIAGNANKPDITGTLTSIRGHYQFLSQNFTIASATATFQGPVPPSPFLNIVAEAPADDITAQVKFTGTLAAPKLVITSAPPLPAEEVLSRLLFQRNVRTLTPAQALRVVSVMRQLLGSGGGEMNFLDRTRSFLKLDDLAIEQNDQGNSAFGVGKYIQKGVYVGAQKNLGNTGGKANVEIEVTPHITVESEIGADNTENNTQNPGETTTQGGVGVNWKYDY